METDYCSFFESDAGQRVLADMLLEGGFFKLNGTPEEQAVQNFLKTVLAKTGKYPIEGVADVSRLVSFVNRIGRRQKQRSVRAYLKDLFTLKTEY
jgi:hypothetical protein